MTNVAEVKEISLKYWEALSNWDIESIEKFSDKLDIMIANIPEQAYENQPRLRAAIEILNISIDESGTEKDALAAIMLLDQCG